jgi:hypothetical protein
LKRKIQYFRWSTPLKICSISAGVQLWNIIHMATRMKIMDSTCANSRYYLSWIRDLELENWRYYLSWIRDLELENSGYYLSWIWDLELERDKLVPHMLQTILSSHSTCHPLKSTYKMPNCVQTFRSTILHVEKALIHLVTYMAY